MKTVTRAFCFILPLILSVQTVSAASSLRVYSARRQINEPQLKYTSCWPRVCGIRDESAQNRLNIRLREQAETAEKTAQLAAKRLAGTGADVKGSFDYAVKRNENGMISLTMRDQLLVGGQRGMTRQAAVTVNTVSGRSLTLGDFFGGNVDYTAMLSDRIRGQIKSRGLEGRQIRPFHSMKPDQGFYLTHDSLVVFFQEYEYFPYDCGVVEFAIPLGALNGCLKPEYRL
ncbi:MAG: RsiV family protein [Clostridia bacterium]|nr:RsiV family protein [Clostridia bacterium]MDR3643858.1 RsiV family protein [Clostridia bacterium]